MKKQTNVLGVALKDFFSNYLPKLRGMSTHTILSYRDSLKLLLQFMALQKRIHVSRIQVEDIGVSDMGVAILRRRSFWLPAVFGVEPILVLRDMVVPVFIQVS
jgi:site-specific recombinase XerC